MFIVAMGERISLLSPSNHLVLSTFAVVYIYKILQRKKGKKCSSKKRKQVTNVERTHTCAQTERSAQRNKKKIYIYLYIYTSTQANMKKASCLLKETKEEQTNTNREIKNF